MRCAGNKILRTPNLDRLAGAGDNLLDSPKEFTSSSCRRCSMVYFNFAEESGSH